MRQFFPSDRSVDLYTGATKKEAEKRLAVLNAVAGYSGDLLSEKGLEYKAFLEHLSSELAERKSKTYYLYRFELAEQIAGAITIFGMVAMREGQTKLVLSEVSDAGSMVLEHTLVKRLVENGRIEPLADVGAFAKSLYGDIVAYLKGGGEIARTWGPLKLVAETGALEMSISEENSEESLGLETLE